MCVIFWRIRLSVLITNEAKAPILLNHTVQIRALNRKPNMAQFCYIIIVSLSILFVTKSFIFWHPVSAFCTFFNWWSFDQPSFITRKDNLVAESHYSRFIVISFSVAWCWWRFVANGLFCKANSFFLYHAFVFHLIDFCIVQYSS